MYKGYRGFLPYHTFLLKSFEEISNLPIRFLNLFKNRKMYLEAIVGFFKRQVMVP